MRAGTIAAGLLIAVLPAARAGHPDGASSRAPSEFARAQAVAYSTQMMAIFQLIEGNYLKPVSKLEWSRAVLVGLNQTPRVPTPASLWAELAVSEFIDNHYIRPAPRIALARAAIVGLYQAAREPVPASLWAELGHARKSGQIAYLLAEARERLGDLDAVRDLKSIHASLSTLSRALDPFSGLPPSDHRSDSRSDTNGVGVKFEWEPVLEERKLGEPSDDAPVQSRYDKPFGPVRVTEVLPGGPAQRAGIRPDDVLTHINDLPVESPGGAQLFRDRLFTNGEALDKLRLTFERPGMAQPIHRELVPTTFDPETVFGVRRRLDNSWDFMLDHERRIGYVRLGFIDGTREDPRTATEMEAAISQLKSAGMRGLIFDMRGCPGGFLDPAKAISGMFVKSGLIADLAERSEENDGRLRHQEFRIENGSGILEGIATIVLIDEETRGGGEMVAAVLQDHHVARMAGRRTFGKGSVQKRFTISEAGVTIWLTTGVFTRPNGKRLQRLPDSREEDDWGIRPDPGLAYDVSPELSKQVKTWMKQQVLRPGDSRESLPLDDPFNDPLREFARNELFKQIK